MCKRNLSIETGFSPFFFMPNLFKKQFTFKIDNSKNHPVKNSFNFLHPSKEGNFNL